MFRVAAGVAEIVGHVVQRLTAANRHVGLRVELEVDPAAALRLGPRADQIDVEGGVRARERIRLRLSLVLIVRKEMNPVADDRTAKGGRYLLVPIRQDAML